MSIASELNNLEGNIEDSYDAVNDMGGVIPAQKNMDNLDQAIRTIPQNQGTTYTAGTGIDITNDVISIDDTVVAELSDIPGVMVGATSSAPGVGGTVPAPAAGDDTKVLSGAGTWVNQPTIPTVNDATLTIQHNGTNVQTFSANSSTNKTANIETIWADDIEATTPVPAVETDMIADGAVTGDKIANSTIASGKIDWTTTSIASAPTIISTTTDYITLNSGYSISYNNVYTLGKIVIMNLIIKSDSGYPNGSQVKVGTLTSAFKPAYNNINTYVGLGSEWDCPEIGYCYISVNGDIHIRSNTAGKNFARLNIVYVRA